MVCPGYASEWKQIRIQDIGLLRTWYEKKAIRVKALQIDNDKTTWVIYTDIDKGYKGQWNMPLHYTKRTSRLLL